MSILAECPICHKKQANKNRICSCGEDLIKAKRAKRVKYWISYRLPGGKQKRELVGHSIKEAQDADGKRKSQKRENRIFDILPESKMTFSELAEWYFKLEKVRALSSFWLVELSIGKFNSVFGDRIISDVKLADLENYQACRRKAGLADSTIDHEIGKTKTMIFKAFDNSLVGAETLKTFRRAKKLLKRNSDVRTRILSKDEFESLMEHSTRFAKGIIATGYYTGMRRGEILSLTWDKVDLKKKLIQLEATDTKDKEARDVPICVPLLAVLREIPTALYDNHVFLFKGKPVNDIRKSLSKACDKAGIIYGRFEKNGFIFHDLRHTFNTNMRKAGVPESVIMKITGHSTREMFDRYNTVDEEDAKNAVEQFEGFLQNVDQTVDQDTKKALTKKA